MVDDLLSAAKVYAVYFDIASHILNQHGQEDLPVALRLKDFAFGQLVFFVDVLIEHLRDQEGEINHAVVLGEVVQDVQLVLKVELAVVFQVLLHVRLDQVK